MDAYYIHRQGLNFYCTSLFGSRSILVPDPSWERPTIEIDDPAWTPSSDEPDAIAPKVMVPDPDAVAPWVEVANPNCTLPPAAELIELSSEQYEQLRDAASRGRPLRIDDDGVPYALEPESPTNDQLLAGYIARVDRAADAARAKVVGDPTRALEYQKAAEEAQVFAAAGYPADAVPRTVSAFMMNERTAQQAADSILGEAAAYNEALYVIRETRLAAKEQIRTLMASGEVEQALQLAEQTIAAIEAAVAGVGNAAA